MKLFTDPIHPLEAAVFLAVRRNYMVNVYWKKNSLMEMWGLKRKCEYSCTFVIQAGKFVGVYQFFTEISISSYVNKYGLYWNAVVYYVIFFND